MPYPPFTAPLTLATLAAQLSGPDAVRLSPEAEQRLGANEPAQAADEQTHNSANLLLAYAVGTGPEVPAPLVRRMLLLLAHSLSQGPAGGALATVRRLLDFYNREVWPVVYTQGALGAAGNHIPLAHLALPLLGLGEVNYQGYRLAAADVLELFGWAPLALSAPETLALLGGHQFGLAYATEVVTRAEHLGRAATAIGALSAAGYGPTLVGQPEVGQALDSEKFLLIQQAIEAACQAAATPELPPVLATPNPDSVGHTIATALSQAAAGLAEIGVWSAQRTAELVAGQHGLPLHLVAESDTGLGLRALPLAAASLAGHSQLLSAPGGVGAVQLGAGLETAARQVVENTEQLLGIELLAAAQALDLRHQAGPGAAPISPALAKVVAAFRAHITFAAPDKPLTPDLHRAAQFVREFAWE
jgi:histidine ammonia-lyase